MAEKKLTIAYPEGGWYRMDVVLVSVTSAWGEGIQSSPRGYVHYVLDDPLNPAENAIANIIVWLDDDYNIAQIQPYPAGMTPERLGDYGFVASMLSRYMSKGTWSTLDNEDARQYKLAGTVHERLSYLAKLARIVDGVEAATDQSDVRWLASEVEDILPARMRGQAQAALLDFDAAVQVAKEAAAAAEAEAELAKAAAEETARNTEYVYVIRHGDDPLYKIGIARDPDKRVRELSTGAPRPLSVVARKPLARARPAERALHRLYQRDRARGEWFELNDEAAAELIARVESLGVTS